MGFKPVTVERLLKAAAQPINPEDTIDALILQNAQRHAQSSPRTVLNMCTEAVARIDELAPVEALKLKPVKESKPAVQNNSAAVENTPVPPQPTPTAETSPETESTAETECETDSVSSETE